MLARASEIHAEETLESAGRAVFEKYSNSVLYVALTVEVQMSVGERNQTTEGSVEVLGTVMQDDGLLVVSNSAIDLSLQVLNQLRSQVPANVPISAEAAVKDAKIILPDGTEVEAEVLLQDADLDLAFLRPLAPEEGEETHTFTPAGFKPDAPRLQLLDDIIVLGRLGKNLNRAPAVETGKIELVVRRPRLLYRSNVSGLAQPAFNANGELAGLFVRNASDEGRQGAGIIRPIKDILKTADRAELTTPVAE